ncbi:MAG TPA: hypothetical protein PKA79_06805 [Oligoflexia bacterium]|nr:hypothetical protein [Oligoflexia bacterium]
MFTYIAPGQPAKHQETTLQDIYNQVLQSGKKEWCGSIDVTSELKSSISAGGFPLPNGEVTEDQIDGLSYVVIGRINKATKINLISVECVDSDSDRKQFTYKFQLSSNSEQKPLEFVLHYLPTNDLDTKCSTKKLISNQKLLNQLLLNAYSSEPGKETIIKNVIPDLVYGNQGALQVAMLCPNGETVGERWSFGAGGNLLTCDFKVKRPELGENEEERLHAKRFSVEIEATYTYKKDDNGAIQTGQCKFFWDNQQNRFITSQELLNILLAEAYSKPPGKETIIKNVIPDLVDGDYGKLKIAMLCPNGETVGERWSFGAGGNLLTCDFKVKRPELGENEEERLHAKRFSVEIEATYTYKKDDNGAIQTGQCKFFWDNQQNRFITSQELLNILLAEAYSKPPGKETIIKNVIPDLVDGDYGKLKKAMLCPNGETVDEPWSFGAGRNLLTCDFIITPLKPNEHGPRVLYTAIYSKTNAPEVKQKVHFIFENGAFHRLKTAKEVYQLGLLLKGQIFNSIVGAIKQTSCPLNRLAPAAPIKLPGELRKINFFSENILFAGAKWGGAPQDIFERVVILDRIRKFGDRREPFVLYLYSEHYRDTLEREFLKVGIDNIKIVPFDVLINEERNSAKQEEYLNILEEAAVFAASGNLDGLKAILAQLSNTQNTRLNDTLPSDFQCHLTKSVDPYNQQEWRNHIDNILNNHPHLALQELAKFKQHFSPYWEAEYHIKMAMFLSYIAAKEDVANNIKDLIYMIYPELKNAPNVWSEISEKYFAPSNISASNEDYDSVIDNESLGLTLNAKQFCLANFLENLKSNIPTAIIDAETTTIANDAPTVFGDTPKEFVIPYDIKEILTNSNLKLTEILDKLPDEITKTQFAKQEHKDILADYIAKEIVKRIGSTENFQSLPEPLQEYKGRTLSITFNEFKSALEALEKIVNNSSKANNKLPKDICGDKQITFTQLLASIHKLENLLKPPPSYTRTQLPSPPATPLSS